jgi:hypothetical protein
MNTARAALGYLAQADAASLPTVVQARLLRELERAESEHTAAERILVDLAVGGGDLDDLARTRCGPTRRATARPPLPPNDLQ